MENFCMFIPHLIQIDCSLHCSVCVCVCVCVWHEPLRLEQSKLIALHKMRFSFTSLTCWFPFAYMDMVYGVHASHCHRWIWSPFMAIAKCYSKNAKARQSKPSSTMQSAKAKAKMCSSALSTELPGLKCHRDFIQVDAPYKVNANTHMQRAERKSSSYWVLNSPECKQVFRENS